MELTRFIQLMMMTTSSHDNEALIAMRKANAMLASQNLNWEEFIGGKYHVPPPKRESQPRHEQPRNNNRMTDANDIDPLFEAAFSKCRPNSSFYHTLSSIHEWWNENSFLTLKQYDVIKRAAGGSPKKAQQQDERQDEPPW